ncbi:MAG: hypothetical protein M0P58_01680 [Bacteroidales bacterium]|jgi:hypothetical protein|nr:hypothetical protein [Bacteroidales bacterium]
MKTNLAKVTSTNKKSNWALPGQDATLDELKDTIKEAEQGPFITVDEFEQRFEEWKHKKGL